MKKEKIFFECFPFFFLFVETNNQQPSRQVGSRLAAFGGNGRPYTHTHPNAPHGLSPPPTLSLPLRELLHTDSSFYLPFLPPFQIETHFCPSFSLINFSTPDEKKKERKIT
jgi:hypothetical protein